MNVPTVVRKQHWGKWSEGKEINPLDLAGTPGQAKAREGFCRMPRSSPDIQSREHTNGARMKGLGCQAVDIRELKVVFSGVEEVLKARGAFY